MRALSLSPHLPYRLLAYLPEVKLSSHLPCGFKHYHDPSSHPCPPVQGFSQCPALAETQGCPPFCPEGLCSRFPVGFFLKSFIVTSSHCNPIPNGAPTLWFLRGASGLWKTLFFVKQKAKHSRYKARSPRSHLPLTSLSFWDHPSPVPQLPSTCGALLGLKDSVCPQHKYAHSTLLVTRTASQGPAGLIQALQERCTGFSRLCLCPELWPLTSSYQAATKSLASPKPVSDPARHGWWQGVFFLVYLCHTKPS